MEYEKACSILGISPSASEQEARSAFKKLAAKYHPDINKEDGAEQKSKEISEAFNFLRDKKFVNVPKPQYGKGGPGPGFNPFEDFDLEEILNNVGFSGFGGKSRKAVGIDVVPLSLTFKEAMLGSKKDVEFDRLILCATFTSPNFVSTDGYGEPIKCPECNSDGSLSTNPGTLMTKSKMNLTIPPGYNPHSMTELHGKGSWNAKNNNYNSIRLNVDIIPDPKFSQDGMNITSSEEISLLQALEGVEIEVSHLHGTSKIKLPSGTKHKSSATLRGYGIPSGFKNIRDGDHVVTFKVKYPQDTSSLIQFLKNGK